MVISDSTIRKDGIAEDHRLISSVIPEMMLRQQDSNSPEIHLSQIRSSHQRFSELSTFQISPTQIGFYQGSFNQISSTQIGSTQISSTQVTLSEASPTQISPTQISSYQNGRVQVSSTQVRYTQINSTQFGSVKISSTQINPDKISLSGIDSIEKLSNIHFLSSYIHDINSTVLPLWNTLFDPINPFDLTFQITDLLIGQLAEAKITNYDFLGRPPQRRDRHQPRWYIYITPNLIFVSTDTFRNRIQRQFAMF